MGWFKDQMARSKQAQAGGTYGVWRVTGDGSELTRPMVGRWPLGECTVTVEDGGHLERVSAGRVVGGLVLLGPAGGIIGALAKVDRAKHYLHVSTPDKGYVEEVPTKRLPAAHKFAHRVAELKTLQSR